MAEMEKSLTYGRNFTFVAIVVLLFVSFLAFSADKTYDLNDYNFGIHVGMTYPPAQNTDGSVLYPYNPAIGFSGGISANYYFIKNLLAVQLEVDYAELCSNEKIDLVDAYGNPLSTVKSNTKWHFAQLPLILIKLSSPWNFMVKPYIMAGYSRDTQFISTGKNYDGLPYVESSLASRDSLIGVVGADYLMDNGNAVSLEFRVDRMLINNSSATGTTVPYTFFTAFVGYSI